MYNLTVEPPPRACGTCSLCCKVYPFPELDKPAGQWCRHHAARVGCAIHAFRPDACRSYQCAWTQNDVLDEAWKPDVARFLLDITPSQVLVVVDPDHPGAWRREPYYSRLKAISSRAQRPFTEVLVFERGSLTMVFPEGDVAIGQNQPGRAIESGYEADKDGMRVPFARYAPAPH